MHFSAKTCKIHRCGRITCVYVHIRSQIQSAFIRRAGVAYLARWQPLIPPGAARARVFFAENPLARSVNWLFWPNFCCFINHFWQKSQQLFWPNWTGYLLFYKSILAKNRSNSFDQVGQHFCCFIKLLAKICNIADLQQGSSTDKLTLSEQQQTIIEMTYLALT